MQSSKTQKLKKQNSRNSKNLVLMHNKLF